MASLESNSSSSSSSSNSGGGADLLGKKRELKRDMGVLSEFNDSEDPNLLVLYHHMRDRAFDAFNAAEYHTQMLRYYANAITLVEVVPRKISDNHYLLVCLKHKEETRNTLCELAFQCQRQFVGICMLVKRRCFVCHKRTTNQCSQCRCACFCSKECQRIGWAGHKALCVAVKAAGGPRLDPESLTIEKV